MDPVEETSVVSSNGGSKKGLYIVIGILVLIILGFLFRDSLGFSRKVSVGGMEGQVTKKLDGSTTYTNDYGTITTGTNRLPDGWPSDAPMYKNATITGTVSSKMQTGLDGLSVTFTTTDSLQTVLDFYKKELVANGWTGVGQSTTMGNVTVLSSKKGNQIFGITVLNAGTGELKVTATTATLPSGTVSR
jgi:hypothetical protein